MIRTCPSCGTKNRIPAEHLADTGRCGSCKADLPPVGEPIDADKALFEDIAGKAGVLKVDTDKHPDLAQRYGVQGIPNFLVMKDGQVVRQQPGYVPHTQLTSWLTEAVGAPAK